MTSLIQYVVSDELEVSTPSGPATNSTTTSTAVSPTTHPSAKAGAVCLGRCDSSISTVAMIGSGLSATPKAAGSRSPSAAGQSVHHVSSRRRPRREGGRPSPGQGEHATPARP